MAVACVLERYHIPPIYADLLIIEFWSWILPVYNLISHPIERYIHCVIINPMKELMN